MFDRRRESGLGLLHIFIIGAFIAALPLALITTTIRAAISEQAVYDYSVEHYDAAEVSGIPESELLRANGEIHQYLTGDYSGPLSITVLHEDGSTGPLFNARETAHMADVRDLVRVLFAVQIGALVALLSLAVVMLVVWPPRALAAAAFYGSILAGAIIAGGGLLVVAGFDAAWSELHGIAFANDFWQLDPDSDHLIQMFPEAFWQRATTVIGGVIAIEAGLVAAVSGLYLYITRPQAGPEANLRPDPALPGREGHARVTPPEPRHPVR